MRHHNVNRTFGRKRKVRRALLRELAVSLIHKEKIVTTEAKAKELRPFVEKLVTHGKTKTVASQRLLISKVGGVTAKKLLNTLGPKYAKRAGGYLRLTKLGARPSDQAKIAQIEFI